MSTVTIRPMVEADLSTVAELAGQWGYPSTPDQIERRFRNILAGSDHALFVAAAADGGMAGWIHVHALYSLESDSCAEIGGLIVDGRRRTPGRRPRAGGGGGALGPRARLQEDPRALERAAHGSPCVLPGAGVRAEQDAT